MHDVACWLHTHAYAGKRVTHCAASIVWIKVVAQAGAWRTAGGPRCVEPPVPVFAVIATGGIAAVQLTDDMMVLIKERRARRAGLGGAKVPVKDANVVITRSVVAIDLAGVIVNRPSLRVHVRVVNCNGPVGSLRAGVPAAVGNLPLILRRAVQANERKVAE